MRGGLPPFRPSFLVFAIRGGQPGWAGLTTVDSSRVVGAWVERPHPFGEGAWGEAGGRAGILPQTMKPITPRQKSLIVNSFKRVFLTRDINNLTAAAYRYIYLASGFIAHYNLWGFRDAYQSVNELREDLRANAQANAWSNFTPGDKNYDYYRSRADVYRDILKVT